MYKVQEINVRQTWVSMLADLRVNDELIADPKDRYKISVAVSNGFHKKGLARFTVKLNKLNKSELIVRRVQ